MHRRDAEDAESGYEAGKGLSITGSFSAQVFDTILVSSVMHLWYYLSVCSGKVVQPWLGLAKSTLRVEVLCLRQKSGR
jgi:hypothetical protein